MFLLPEERETDSYNVAYRIFQMILEEIKFHALCRRYLTEHDFELLFRYYSSWIRTSNVSYFGHLFAERFKPLVSCITEQGDVMSTVLDCGCGLGSESLACALLGAKVVGIDLFNERIAVAKKRLDYFEERFRRDLDVNFFCKDILTYEPKEKFDIVYAKEFISHVWSLPAFFKFARKILKEHGHLIVTDANLLNPYTAFRAYLDHRTALFTAVHDPETRKKILYARERLFFPHYLTELLIQHGFKPASTTSFGFFIRVPERFLNVARILEKIVSKIPIGTAYEITGMKA